VIAQNIKRGKDDMKKVMVIGCPGSGKSTFSRKLRDITNLPLYHLDMMFWNADKTTVERSVFLERLSKVIESDEWIIDGNYNSSLEMRMIACDTVVFLDYSSEVCLNGIKERRGKPREDMPWIETEEDLEFTKLVKDFNEKRRPNIISLLEKYYDKNIIVFKSREEATKFLFDYAGD
jgi:adenylate kinase family enzyme